MKHPRASGRFRDRRRSPRGQVDARGYDQRKARAAILRQPRGAAEQRRIGRFRSQGRLLHHERRRGRPDRHRSRGLGMWGTICGFLSLDHDTNTVRGLTY
jgi:hypothetical protein